jgi:hypothetical protein
MGYWELTFLCLNICPTLCFTRNWPKIKEPLLRSDWTVPPPPIWQNCIHFSKKNLKNLILAIETIRRKGILHICYKINSQNTKHYIMASAKNIFFFKFVILFTRFCRNRWWAKKNHIISQFCDIYWPWWHKKLFRQLPWFGKKSS